MKLSKYETLQMALSYIEELSRILNSRSSTASEAEETETNQNDHGQEVNEDEEMVEKEET